MKISFHGAAQTVTGSKHLITLDNDKRLLLDCGMFQGLGPDTDKMNAEFGFDARTVDYIVLSHAHIDHCGLIPKLVKEGFNGKIFATPGTKALAQILLEDSAGIQESDAKFSNKRLALKGEPLIEPLYTTEDAFKAIELFETVDYDTWFNIDNDVKVCYTDAGHIIGSAAVHLRINENGKETKITFSGDVGRYDDMILKEPKPFEQADYIIIESTYGDSLHKEFMSTPDDLLRWINKTCVEKKGKLIMPAFSVGRTQEILYALNVLSLEGRLPAIQYFVDSPLSSKATQVLKSFPGYFNNDIQNIMKVDKDPFDFPGLYFTKSVEESKRLNLKKEPCVIISASGMAEAGRIKHHISNNIESNRNTILLTGYCEPRSLGGRLKRGADEVSIFGQLHDVNAEIGEIRSMSAHGDRDDLLQFLACQNPELVKKVFVVHGEPEVQMKFAETLNKNGFANVSVPHQHESFQL